MNKPPLPGFFVYCLMAGTSRSVLVFPFPAGTTSQFVRKARSHMKKILKMLVLGLLSAALLCCALPSAFAAEDKDSQVYTIGLDAMGGTSSVVAVTTNLNGKLSALPAQPTLDGYTFDGWYTETVGGTKVTTSTVFTGDTTVYAHWTVKSTAASSSTSTSKPAQPEQTEQDDGMTLSILTVAGALLTTLAVAAFI